MTTIIDLSGRYVPPERVKLSRYEIIHAATRTASEIYEYIRADVVEKMIQEAVQNKISEK